jgi:hypothetical protein
MDPEQIPLRDLHLPAEIGWWPLAPGWWVLIGIAAAGLTWFAWIRFLEWRANRARRIALRELEFIDQRYRQNDDVQQLAKDLSELLRRGLLAYAPRQVVAGLTGEDWLRWLDRGLDEPVFEQGAGRLLGSLPYRRSPDANDAEAAQDLVAAVRQRLMTPLPEGGA